MKICFTVIRNKKLGFWGEETKDITSHLASHGFYCDKITCVSQDNGGDISKALREMKECYDTGIVFCPERIIQTLMEYLNKLYGGQIEEDGSFETKDGYLFITDGKKGASPKIIAEKLTKKTGFAVQPMYIKTYGAPAGVINEALSKTQALGNGLLFRIYGQYGDNTIEVMYDKNTPSSVAQDAVRNILLALDKYIYYSGDEDVSLAQQLYRLLKLRRLKICVAESFTGGGIARKLVEVPGVSEVYLEGLNTYSNESKMERLGVTDYALTRHGAVSAETAKEMAKGLLQNKLCDIGVSTTGIAGPKSDNTNKPVGLCYIGISYREKVGEEFKDMADSYECHFGGDRKAVTETAINKALFLAYKKIKSMN